MRGRLDVGQTARLYGFDEQVYRSIADFFPGGELRAHRTKGAVAVGVGGVLGEDSEDELGEGVGGGSPGKLTVGCGEGVIDGVDLFLGGEDSVCGLLIHSGIL